MERTRCLGWAPLSHRGGAPTAKPGFSPNRRSTRPGCECGLGRFAPRAVLLHPSRDFPAPKPGFSPNRRGTRPGSAAVGYVGGAAAVDVGEDQVQGFAAAAGGGVVDDGGDGPALAVVVAGDAGDGADVAQGAG